MRCFPLSQGGSASFFHIGLGLPSISREDNGCVSRLLFAERRLGPDLIFTCHRSPPPAPPAAPRSPVGGLTLLPVRWEGMMAAPRSQLPLLLPPDSVNPAMHSRPFVRFFCSSRKDLSSCFYSTSLVQISSPGSLKENSERPPLKGAPNSAQIP